MAFIAPIQLLVDVLVELGFTRVPSSCDSPEEFLPSPSGALPKLEWTPPPIPVPSGGDESLIGAPSTLELLCILMGDSMIVTGVSGGVSATWIVHPAVSSPPIVRHRLLTVIVYPLFPYLMPPVLIPTLVVRNRRCDLCLADSSFTSPSLLLPPSPRALMLTYNP
jgi:hypothetical protein